MSVFVSNGVDGSAKVVMTPEKKTPTTTTATPNIRALSIALASTEEKDEFRRRDLLL